ncbi:MAG: DUF951 domain-containing protein [Candidatus Izimaplasma sp.]|nr:DUF951 domain-containing protein [Candidatus Izimaplasma bacterium]
MEKINIGDIITLKKPHPCGSYNWKVIRIGADLKLQCLQCDRIIMLDRPTVRKRLKNIKHVEE